MLTLDSMIIRSPQIQEIVNSVLSDVNKMLGGSDEDWFVSFYN